MAEENNNEKAFIVRFVQGEGFKIDPVGGELPTSEIMAMMDACLRQYTHSRLGTMEDALRLHSGLLKKIMGLLQAPDPEQNDDSATDQVVEED